MELRLKIFHWKVGYGHWKVMDDTNPVCYLHSYWFWQEVEWVLEKENTKSLGLQKYSEE